MNKGKKMDLFINMAQQSVKGNLSDKFELFTTGRLKKDKNRWIVEYENEYNGISKIILNDDKSVKIKTDGEISYVLKLNTNKPTKFSCSTKGTFSYFSVYTKDISFDLDETGGRIDLLYFLEIDDVGGLLKTRLQIKLK